MNVENNRRNKKNCCAVAENQERRLSYNMYIEKERKNKEERKIMEKKV